MPEKRLLLRLTVSSALVAATGTALTACGSGGLSLPSSISSAVSSAASQAANQAASAIAAVKGAVDATSDVQSGRTSTDSIGRTVSRLTVTNPTGDQHNYTISVAFDDTTGNLLDVVVVSVSAVPAHGSTTATAQSNRPLTDADIAKVTAAVRH